MGRTGTCCHCGALVGDVSQPAFPSHGAMGEVSQEGMTLRDYFAAKAMAASISRVGYFSDELKVREARNAYAMADAMLAAREVQS